MCPGLLYLRVGTELPQGQQDRVSGLWYALAILCFTPSYTALVVWDKERLLLRRETQTGARRGLGPGGAMCLGWCGSLSARRGSRLIRVTAGVGGVGWGSVSRTRGSRGGGVGCLPGIPAEQVSLGECTSMFVCVCGGGRPCVDWVCG
jgi:hypothetical protein